MSFPVTRTHTSFDRLYDNVRGIVTSVTTAFQGSKLWATAALVSACTTKSFWQKTTYCATRRCSFHPQVKLLGVKLPQTHAVAMTVFTTFLLLGVTAVSMLQVSRRVEQFQKPE